VAQWDVATGTLGAKLRLIVDLVSQDAVANTSRIRLRLQIVNVPSATFIGSPGDSCSISGTGISTFTTTFTWPSGTASRTLIDIERTVAHDPDGTFDGTYTGSIAATGTSGIGGPTTNGPRSFSTPTLVVPPNVPTGCSAVRVSDAAATVSWSQSHPSNGQPTTNTIRQRVNGGPWADVATITPAGSASVGIAPNGKYEYAVRAANTAGESAWSATSAPIYTTPAAPTNVQAAKDAALDITVSWTPNVGFSEHEHVVEFSTNGGSSWSALATVAAGTTSFKHVAPNPSLAHVYRVRARNTATGSLTSAWVQSNSVQLLTAPNAPTVPPLPAFAERAAALTVPWVHNPIDTTGQTAFEVGFSINGGSSWSTTGKVTSATQSRVIAANTYAANQQVLIRVRTWGQATSGGSDATGASPWSNPITVTFKTRPVATILAPANGGVYVRSALTVQLGFSQAEAATFVSATIELYQGATLLEQIVSTTLASTTLATRVANGGSYQVRATVTDSNGIVSSQVVSSFTVAYTEPVPATVAVSYAAESGVGQIALTIPAPGAGQAAAVAVTITRTVDGVTETVVEQYPAAASLTILDMIPTIHGENVYRVTTISGDGAETVVQATLTTAEEEWAFMSAGPGYSTIIRFGGELKPQAKPVVDSRLVKTSGRARPVGLYGPTGSLTVSGTGEVVTGLGSSAEDIESFLLIPGRGCYRDPSGRRIIGRITGQVSRESFNLGTFTYSVEETA
jgi:hypothetical protein